MICITGKRCPRRRLPPQRRGNDDGSDSGDDGGGDPGDDDPFGMHPMCCAACRYSISELYASVDECFQAMEAIVRHGYPWVPTDQAHDRPRQVGSGLLKDPPTCQWAQPT
jgi:hypothetical protein